MTKPLAPPTITLPDGKELHNTPENRAYARMVERNMEAKGITPVVNYDPAPSLKSAAPDNNILTDTTNAELIASLYGDQLRFDHRRRRWLLWAAHYWREDTTGEVYRLATAAARERYSRSVNIEDLDERRRVAKWSIDSEQRNRLESAVALAKNIQPIADSGETWDTDPWLLGMANGVVDLRGGKLRNGRPNDQITLTTGIEFDPEAKCPRWEQFLQEVIGDSELINWLWRALGYSLTGDTREQCIFLCHGIGANGKTKLVEAIREAMGGYAYSSPFSTFERYQRASIPNDLAALEHKRLVTSSETNDNTRLNEARIKAISGGDPITARYLHAEYFTFMPHLKLWLFVNHRPKVMDDSHGFWRRVKLIPFTKQFTGEADDKRLGEVLRSEAPGILAWLVKGCLEWQQRGLDPAPRAVEVATEEYRAESDELGGFIIERCVERPGGRVRASELYNAYTGWAVEQGMKDKEILSTKAFGMRIGNKYHRDRGEEGVFYAGLSLNSGENVGSMYDSKASAPKINVFPHTPLHVEKNTETLHNPTLDTKTLHNPTSEVESIPPTKGTDVVEV